MTSYNWLLASYKTVFWLPASGMARNLAILLSSPSCIFKTDTSADFGSDGDPISFI